MVDNIFNKLKYNITISSYDQSLIHYYVMLVILGHAYI